ncbi:hypothetical protein ACQ4PT_048217 [Festuca glaucescens]
MPRSNTPIGSKRQWRGIGRPKKWRRTRRRFRRRRCPRGAPRTTPSAPSPPFSSSPTSSPRLNSPSSSIIFTRRRRPRGKTLKNRRLQNWGGVVHDKGLLPQALPPWLTKITDKICQWTGLFPSAINHVLINEYHPNQGIMPHQDGPAYFPVVAIISLASPVVIDFTPHGKLRGHEYTYLQTVQSDELQESNGSYKVEDTKEADPASLSLLLMPSSLLIFKDQAYTDFLHGIQDNELHILDKVANILQCPQFKNRNSDYRKGKADADTELTGTFQQTTTRVSLTCRLVLKVHNKLFKF